MKKLVIGILAHVDAGKTTLAESMLYLTGNIRKLGRVDHKDAFLDTYELERARGITIFSKQAVLTFNDMEVYLLDTPGHVDFSSEMERTLQVLDYAILVISGSDGIQGHTKTLWKLLARYKIPAFIFINKMDLEGTDRTTRMSEFKKHLNDGCVDFSDDQSTKIFMENLAMCDETLLNQYIENGEISTQDIIEQIAVRNVFPCYFGSALKLDGVDAFLSGLLQYTCNIQYTNEFGAKIYKIGRDVQGNRLTYMKVTGGSLKVKMQLTSNKEKVDQIRIYSGARYEAVDEVEAGAVCALTGLNSTYPGQGLGIEAISDMPVLEPVLNYKVILPPECDASVMLSKLRQLEEEDPQLHLMWSAQLKEIHIQLMGEVQVEILRTIILERFGVNVEFGPGNIVYKETILEPVEGIGHFEPLRHYAEVHLLLEPNEAGSGITFASNCSEDVLDRNWQRLILTHLEEKEHVGVLTGSPVTDINITLIAGRAHQKHTEGGDFRQATYRAVRQGLKMAKSILLEPYYNYRLEIPSESVGRAMTDIQRMSGDFSPPELHGEISVLSGCAPVATMMGYQTEVTAYTRGRGRLFCTLKGYQPCHNADEMIAAIGYDSERDLDNPTGSVFCSHGAGFVVEWDKVNDYMHVDSTWQLVVSSDTNSSKVKQSKGDSTKGRSCEYSGSWQEDKELEEIFIRTFGPIGKKLSNSSSGFGYEKKTVDGINQIKKSVSGENKLEILSKIESGKFKNNKHIESMKIKAADFTDNKIVMEYLLVDGYNIIFSWDELDELAQVNLDAARNKLMDILCNYQGYKKCILILVFDAYKVKGGIGSVQDYHNIHVVYTKEAETADMYIEKVAHKIAREHRVTVATSDALEQLIIMGRGAVRLSAKDLKDEIMRISDQIQREYLDRQPTGRNYLGEKMEKNITALQDE